MPLLTTIVVHEQMTEVRGFRYQFTPKHHGAVADAAQWLPDLSLDNEFAVFNLAVRNDLADDQSWLYGIQPMGDGLQDLGTWSQQIAEFPLARENEPWHGYPIWAISGLAPQNRRGEKMRPDKDVFLKMERAGLLTTRQRKRLFKGEHV